MAEPPILLSVLEVGGYPDFSDLYEGAGYRVIKVQSMRKALVRLKTATPAFVVAEFNYAPTYGSRISTVEPLLARLQSHHADAGVLLFIDRENIHHLHKLRPQFGELDFLTYPVNRDQLVVRLKQQMASK